MEKSKLLPTLKHYALAQLSLRTKIIRRYLIGITLIITGLNAHPVFGQTLPEIAALLNIQSNGIAKTAPLPNTQSNDLSKAAALLIIEIESQAKVPAPVRYPYNVNAKSNLNGIRDISSDRLKVNSKTTESDAVILHLDNLVKGVFVSKKASLVSKREAEEDQEVAAAQKAVAALKATQRAARLKRFQQAAAQKIEKPVPVIINGPVATKPKTDAKNLAEVKAPK